MDIQTVLMGVGLLAATGVAYGICCSIRNAARDVAHGGEEFFAYSWPVTDEGQALPVTVPAPANCNWPGLSDDQQAVLMEMPDERSRTAAVLARYTGVDVEHVKVIRRDLRGMGLASYGPVFDEDTGAPNGSGYILTSTGREIKAHLYDRMAKGLAA